MFYRETEMILILDGKLMIDLKADGDKGRWVTNSSSRVYWPPGPQGPQGPQGLPASHTARIDSTASSHTVTGQYSQLEV